MDIWLLYRIFKNPDTGMIERIEPIEYFKLEADVRKYGKFFDLQTPIDLKDKIGHKHFVTQLCDE